MVRTTKADLQIELVKLKERLEKLRKNHKNLKEIKLKIELLENKLKPRNRLEELILQHDKLKQEGRSLDAVNLQIDKYLNRKIDYSLVK